MADRPILFSGPMVRALLDGRKAQTRRVITPQPAEFTPQVIDIGRPYFDDDEGRWGQIETEWSSPSWDAPMGEPMREVFVPLPIRFAVGDRLWVREAWRCNGWASDVATIFYRASEGDGYTAMCEQVSVADHKPMRVTGTWRPGIHMPRWASRLTLAVTKVRVERLQDISEADAIAEGIEFVTRTDSGDFYRNFANPGCPLMAYGAYRSLWDILNAKRGFGWDANPWVVAVSFDVVRANIDSEEFRHG